MNILDDLVWNLWRRGPDGVTHVIKTRGVPVARKALEDLRALPVTREVRRRMRPDPPTKEGQ